MGSEDFLVCEEPLFVAIVWCEWVAAWARAGFVLEPDSETLYTVS